MAKKRRKLIETQFIFDINQLENLIAFSLVDNDLITAKSYKKLYDLAMGIDKSIYKDDRELYARVLLLRKVIRAKFEKKIYDAEEILSLYCSSGDFVDDFNDIIDIINERWSGEEGITDDEIYAIDEFITDILNYSYIFKYQDKLDDLSLRLKSNDFDSIHDVCESYQNIIDKLYVSYKQNQELNEDQVNDFSSNDDSMDHAVEKAHQKLNSPSNKLKTSVKMKNKMLNGGFECGRCHLIIGLQGGGKSLELLTCALDIKHYNQNLKLEGNKKPSILFVTQENSIRETIERVWGYYMGDNNDFKNFTTKEAIKELKKHGFNEGINIDFKYRKSKSIDTADIDSMISDIERNGNTKVICVVQDYIKRIRSTANYPNAYEELGEVVDEFCSIAKSRDIVVISAMQFNRSAMTIIEEGLKKQKSDVLKSVGSSSISESIKVVDNADVIYSVYRKPHPETGNIMVSYKRLKYRGKIKINDDVEYFSHPTEDNNTVKLAPDLNLTVSLSVMESGNGLENFDPIENRKKHIKQKLASANAKDNLKQMVGGKIKKSSSKLQKMITEDDEEDE